MFNDVWTCFVNFDFVYEFKIWLLVVVVFFLEFRFFGFFWVCYFFLLRFFLFWSVMIEFVFFGFVRFSRTWILAFIF